jgi:hypothetical protein
VIVRDRLSTRLKAGKNMKISFVSKSNHGHTAKLAEMAVAQHSMVWGLRHEGPKICTIGNHDEP